MAQQTKQQVDIVIVGGGAAGLMAAVTAARECKRMQKQVTVAVLEGAARIGKKLLATGNGRCNLTNTHMDFSHYYGDSRLLEPILKRYTPTDIMETFLSFGLLCKEEDEGRVYPYNVQAAAVLELLRRQLDDLNVKILCDFPINAIKRTNYGFELFSNEERVISAKKVILAFGGKASPQLGSNGSGFALAQAMGHSVTSLFPALVQLKTTPERAKPLKGMRSTAVASLLVDGTMVKKEMGEVQFTENGLSGICIFQLSRLASEYFVTHKCSEKPCKSVEIALDLMPDYSKNEVVDLLKKSVSMFPNLPCGELLTGLLNKRVGQEIVKHALLQARELPAKTLEVFQLEAIADVIKDFRFPIIGTMPWLSAQVTAGGVPLSEVELTSMQSLKCNNLFLAGELLNIDGDCGGYNLHWAWCSGIIAGRAAAKSEK